MILCTFLSLLISVVDCSRYHTPADCPLNHINHDPRFGLIEEIEVSDEFECMAVCDDTEDCVAYNVELPELVCEFNEDQTNEYGDDMITKDGWTYWEKLKQDEQSEACDKNYLYGRKQREVTSRGTHTLIVGRGNAWGFWGKDTFLDDPRIYYIPSHSNGDDLHEYDNEESFKSNTNYYIHYITPKASGSGYIIYNRQFWYREHDVKRLMVWDLDANMVVATVNLEVMEGTYGPSGHTCAYDWNGLSSMDLEVDEMGRMYMIWGDTERECSLRISRIDTSTYRIVRTYGIEGMFRNWGGSGFIVDDIYYMTDHHKGDPTWIVVEWNFRNTSSFMRQTGTNGIANAISWSQPHGHNPHMHWNPVDQRLYATHYGQHYRSELTFREIP